MIKRSSYSQYFGKKRKEKARRILIPAVLILSILSVTLMLGNLLLDRLVAAEPLLALPAVSYPEQDTSVKTPAQLLLHKDKHTPDVRYTAHTLGSPLPDFDSLSAVYGGISVSVPQAWSDETVSEIRRIAERAAKAGMDVCCVLSLKDYLHAEMSETLDAIEKKLEVLREVNVAEILLTGITGEESIVMLAEVPGKIRAAVPRARAGLGVTSAALESAPFAPALEVLAEAADYLALDGTTSHTAEETVDLAFRHRGSIRYFSLRVLIRGDADARQQTETALLAEGYTSLQSIP